MSNNPFETVSDEMLMAYVDGELDAQTAAAVRAAISGDPALAEVAAMFQQTRQDSLAAFADILAERPPERLVEAVSQAPTNQLRPSPARRAPARRTARSDGRAGSSARRLSPAWGIPLAACLMVAAGFGGFLAADLRQQETSSPGLLAFGAGDTFGAALSSQPSGAAVRIDDAADGAELTVLGTYEVASGLCRVFALQPGGEAGAMRGLACRAGGADWRIELALRESGAADTYSPASDRVASVIDDQLDARGAGAPLDREAEARALARPDPR